MAAHIKLKIINVYYLQESFDTRNLTAGVLFIATMILLIGEVSEIIPEISWRSEKCPTAKIRSMAFEELKQDLIEAEADMRSYMENSEEYLRLKIFKVLMRYVTSTVQFLLIGAGVIFSLLFFSLGASLALSEALDSFYSGFINGNHHLSRVDK